jgi:FHA domain
MADRSDVMRRPPRAPLRPRSRRRWAVAAAMAALWALLLAGTGSLVVGTALLMLFVAVGVVCAVALRSLGINGDHPWVRQLATRPWRDGSDVLRLGLRHVAEVFIVTPTGSLLAPNAIELLMNPDDLAALTETMDLEVINASATELYSAQVTARGARLASIGPVAASVTGDPAVPAGRYRFRQGRLPVFAPPDAYRAPSGSHLAPPDAYRAPSGSHLVPPDAYSAPSADQLAPPDAYLASPADYCPPSAVHRAPPDAYRAPSAGHVAPPDVYRAPPDVYLAPPDGDLAPPDGDLASPDGDLAYPNGNAFPYAHDGRTRGEPAARTILTGQLTVTEAVPAPLLRLVTRGSAVQTRVSGARAGRGDAVELRLPDEPTVSRVHAEFTFAGGQWRITSLGRNGMALNGMPLDSEHVLSDGDSIQWGRRSDAMVSRVEIG